MKKIALLLSLISILFSCSEVKEKKEEKILLQVGKVQEKKCKLSELLESVELIPLETTDSCLIGGNRNKNIVYKESVYICSGEEIFKFHKDGKFIRKLSGLGNGPSDYLSINDFDVIERNNNVEVWISHSKGISRYDDVTFDFLGIIKTEYAPLQFKYLSDEIIVLVTPGEFSFHLCDITGKIRDGFLPNDPANLEHGIVQFVRIEQKLFYPLAQTDEAITYNEETDKLEVVKYIDGIKGLLTREDNREYMERYGYLAQPKKVEETFQRIVTFRQAGNKTVFFIRSPKDERIFIGRGNNEWDSYVCYPEPTIENDLFPPGVSPRFMLYMVSCDCDNAFLGCLSASDLAGTTVNGKVINEEDNPVLIKYLFR